MFAYCNLAEVCRVGGCSAELYACATDPNVEIRKTLVIRSTLNPAQTGGLLGRLRNMAFDWMPGNSDGNSAVDHILVESVAGSGGLSGGSIRIGSSAASSVVCAGLTSVGLRALLRDGRQSLQVLDIDGGRQASSVSIRIVYFQHLALKVSDVTYSSQDFTSLHFFLALFQR